MLSSEDPNDQLMDRALPAIARLESSLSDERERLRQAVHSANLLEALSNLGHALADERERLRQAIHSPSLLEALSNLGHAIAKERKRLDAIELIAPRGWYYEEFHSRIISWLLDPSAHHQQAERFIAALLDATNAPQGLLDADWSAAQIRREWKHVVDGREGYLDILILNRDCRSLIAIENKTRSPEHSNQLTRYRRALADVYPNFDRHHVFLSPDGNPPALKRDQKHWQPVSYSVIHDAIRGVLGTGVVADPDANALLQIYATTIRRNVMPDTSLNQQARRIYLEHREAIERIIANKPNWKDETKPMLREAIAKRSCWKLDYEDTWWVRFRAVAWDEFPSSKTGIGWQPNSDALFLFQFGFGSQSHRPYLNLGLSTGNPQNAEIRKILFDAVMQNPDVFKLTSYVLTDGWMILHEEPDYILEPDDYGPGWDDGAARSKIEAWIDDFATKQFPEMNRIIVDCLKRHQETSDAT